MENTFESKDKQVVPFLLTQPEVRFLGTRLVGSTLFFQFSPRTKCQQLANDFASHKAPCVDPKALLEAVETFRDYVFGAKERMKEKGEEDGGNNGIHPNS